MEIKTVSMVKHPIQKVWETMLNDLPNLVHLIDDIESITVESHDRAGDNHQVVNIWKSVPPIPKQVINYLDSNLFIWTDRALWDKDSWECRWQIEPHRFKDRINCSGVTVFKPAMGGRGTRVTFTTIVSFNNSKLPGVPNVLESAIYKAIGVFMKTIIPKNFRKVINAIAIHLDSQPD